MILIKVQEAGLEMVLLFCFHLRREKKSADFCYLSAVLRNSKKYRYDFHIFNQDA